MKKPYVILFFTSLTLCLLTFWIFQEYKKVRNYNITSWSEDHRADCAVSLTGQAYRIEEGFSLLKQGQVNYLIISGVHQNSSLEEIFPNWPFYGNLDRRKIFLEKKSKTTYGNAKHTLRLAQKIKCQSLIVITSHFHMHRAFSTFKSIFPETIKLQSHSIVSGRLHPPFYEALEETFKSLFYTTWVY